MTPFPESEDMTIKRLYVALNRGDMQLLQMGAHKLHEKFHTGYEFKLIDNLREILNYVNGMTNLPSDTKELLVGTINNILSTKNQPQPLQENVQNFTAQNIQQQNPAPIPEPINSTRMTEAQIMNSNMQFNQQPYNQTNTTPAQEHKPDEPVKRVEIIKEDTNIQNQTANVQTAMQNNTPVYEQNQPQQQIQTEQKQPEAPYQEPSSSPLQENVKQEQENPPSIVPIQQNVQYSANASLNNVAVFYDDKASFIDFKKNKQYRNMLDLISIGEDKEPLKLIAELKNIIDVPTDEINEVIKMLNMIKGDVHFVTTSKSENIIKTFIENYVSFEIPLVTRQEFQGRTTSLIPLFGLSNIFCCPKCGEREFFGGFHNKVLTLQCKKCAAPAYPDVYEADGLETNSHVYNWIFAIKQMSKADTWILINPPIETNKELIVEFLKHSFEIAHPKKVYIFSKETSKREYYKQTFSAIYQDVYIKSDFATADSLCEDFINNEMASVKAN